MFTLDELEELIYAAGVSLEQVQGWTRLAPDSEFADVWRKQGRALTSAREKLVGMRVSAYEADFDQRWKEKQTHAQG